MIGEKSVGPFMGVQNDKIIKFGSRLFRIVTYQAYNAHGLIGSEFNGVAILDENTLQVVADNIGCENSGYYGVSKKQVDIFEKICTMKLTEFRAFVNNTERLRMEI